MSNRESMKFGDNDYKFVPARLKRFREDNPRGDIDTNSTINADGSVTFKTRIVKDLADEFSPRASGTARYTAKEMEEKSAFEKLETKSVGRALALLGYLNDGQVATTEEMLEFEASKSAKYADKIEEAESVETLIELFNQMNAIEKKLFTEALSAKKAELLAMVKGGDKEKAA